MSPLQKKSLEQHYSPAVPANIKRPAIRIRVGGGVVYQDDPRAVDEAVRSHEALAEAKEDTLAARQQVLRLKQRFADIKLAL